MNLSFSEVVILICLILLALVAYNKHDELEYAKETILLQNEAILKQKELIRHQIRYISIIEMQGNQLIDNPIHRGPI